MSAARGFVLATALAVAACSGAPDPTVAAASEADPPTTAQEESTTIDRPERPFGVIAIDVGSARRDAGASTDAGTASVNACVDFVDRSAPAADRTVTLPANGKSGPYAPRCIKVRVGQTVTFDGNLEAHPLEARGGSAPTPFVGTGEGGRATFAFGRAGTFGFGCDRHDKEIGAVLVVP